MLTILVRCSVPQYQGTTVLLLQQHLSAGGCWPSGNIFQISRLFTSPSNGLPGDLFVRIQYTRVATPDLVETPMHHLQDVPSRGYGALRVAVAQTKAVRWSGNGMRYIILWILNGNAHTDRGIWPRDSHIVTLFFCTAACSILPRYRAVGSTWLHSLQCVLRIWMGC
jgi:hypothetical protein